MRRRSKGGRAGWFVGLSTGALAALLFVACGGGSSHPAASPSPSSAPAPTRPSPSSTAPTPTTAELPDVAPIGADFVNINTMTKVGDHFVGSLNGHLAASLAVAHAGKGTYPVGTVIQLFPTEAMVKRHAGYSLSTNDWEFFQLSVTPQGTDIANSGAKVKNFFGGDCSSCHRAAANFDFVCEKNHGCPPLGVSDARIESLQRGDPRPK